MGNWTLNREGKRGENYLVIDGTNYKQGFRLSSSSGSVSTCGTSCTILPGISHRQRHINSKSTTQQFKVKFSGKQEGKAAADAGRGDYDLSLSHSLCSKTRRKCSTAVITSATVLRPRLRWELYWDESREQGG